MIAPIDVTPEEDELVSIVGKEGCRSFLDMDCITRLRELEGMGLSPAKAREVKDYYYGNGAVPHKIESLDDIRCGRTIRGIGALRQVSWFTPSGEPLAKSFVNIFESPERYRRAFLAQKFFHHMIKHVRQRDGPKAYPDLFVSNPTYDTNELMLSSSFIDGEPLHKAVAGMDLETALRDVAQLNDRLRRDATELEEEIYDVMGRTDITISIPRGGIFEPVDYFGEFVEKFICRLHPDLGVALREQGLLGKAHKTGDWEPTIEYVGSLDGFHAYGLVDVMRQYRDELVPLLDEQGRAVSHRDTQWTNWIKTSNGYGLVDFEWAGKDVPFSWQIYSYYQALDRGLEDLIPGIRTIPKAHLNATIAHNSLLWAGRYKEWERIPDVENPGELTDLANYRFTHGIRSLEAAGLEDLSGLMQQDLLEHFYPQNPGEMEAHNGSYHPLRASISIVDAPTSCSLEKIREDRQRKKQRIDRIFWSTFALTTLALIGVGGTWSYKTINREQAEMDARNTVASYQFFARERYRTMFRETYEQTKDAILERHLDDRLSIGDPFIDEYCKEQIIVDPKMIRNMLRVNRIYIGIDEPLSDRRYIRDINLLWPFSVEGVDFGEEIATNPTKPNPNDYDLKNPRENFKFGVKQYMHLQEIWWGKDKEALAQYYFPFVNGHWPHSSSIDEEQMEQIKGDVRTIVYNVLEGPIWHAQASDPRLFNAMLKTPPDDFKIDWDFVNFRRLENKR